jgi:hypothetical protein
VLTNLANLETFLAALFLWYTPFVQAISIAFVAATNSFAANSLSLLATAASTFLMQVFTPLLIALFLSFLVRATIILFLLT